MRHVSTTVATLLGIAAMAPSFADAAIKIPACPALAAWVAKFDPNDKVALNQTNRNMWLHGLLLAPDTEKLFGAPALKWTAEDLANADKQVVACWGEARKAGPARAAEVKALETFRANAVRQFGGVLQVAAGTDKRIDDSLAALLAVPPSRDAYRALAAIGKAQGGSAEAWQAANAELAGVPGGPARQQSANLLLAMRDGLTTSSERVFAPVAKRLDEVRPAAVQEASAQLATPPATPDGLRALDALLARTKAELKSLPPADLAALDAAAASRRDAIEGEILAGETAKLAAVPAGQPGLAALQSLQASPAAGALSEPRKAAFAKSVAERRDAIEDEMLEGETAKLASLPPGPQGLVALQAVQTGPTVAALSPARQATLRQRVEERRVVVVAGIVDAQIKLLEQFPTTPAGLRDLELYRENVVRALPSIAPAPQVARFAEAAAARREALGAAVVDQQIAELDRFKPTLAGLGELESFRAGTVQALQQAGGARNAARFIDAASARTDVLARDALPEFRSALAALPANEQGMATFRAMMTSLDPTIGRMDKALQGQYAEVATAKLASLEKAVAAEDARLQALPLAGATYVDVDRSDMKLEFRDAKFVHITAPMAGTLESEYRVDGDRVTILKFLTGADAVLYRRGAYLVDVPDVANAGFKVKRASK